MTKKVVIIYSLSIFIIFGCFDGLKKIQEFNDDGTLYKQYTVDKDSLIQGEMQVYFEDGKTLFERSNYKNGRLDGKRNLFFENGTTEIIETYRDDVLIDTLFVYFPSGRLMRTAPYNEGVLQGIVSVYLENGSLKEKVTFANNLENGPFTEYHSNGQIKWKGQFRNGDNEYGELLEHDENGQVIRKMMCDENAICRTTWKLSKEDSAK